MNQDHPTSDPLIQLGRRLHTRRTRAGLTLAQLAERVGCARSYLSQVETARRTAPPSDELLTRLEEALAFEEGDLTSLARWHRTPATVREEVEHMHKQKQAIARLTAILRAGPETSPEHAPAVGEASSLDRAWQSGELRRLVSAIDPGASLEPASLPLEVPLINKVTAGYPTEFTDLGYPARVADEYVRVFDLEDPDAFAARVVGDSMEPQYHEGDIVVFSPAHPVTSGSDCFARLEPDDETTFKRVFLENDPDQGEMIRLQPINNAYPPRVLPRERVAGLYPAVSVTRRIGHHVP